MARQKKILISIPDSLLDEADNMAYSQNINRSEFIRDAIKSYIREKKKNEIHILFNRNSMFSTICFCSYGALLWNTFFFAQNIAKL